MNDAETRSSAAIMRGPFVVSQGGATASHPHGPNVLSMRSVLQPEWFGQEAAEGEGFQLRHRIMRLPTNREIFAARE